MTTSACSPSPTSRRKIPARPFHRTGMLARQTGITFLSGDTERRALRWLALRGSPPGNRALPDIAYASPLSRVRPVAFGEAEAGLSMAKLVGQEDRSQISLDLRKQH